MRIYEGFGAGRYAFYVVVCIFFLPFLCTGPHTLHTPTPERGDMAFQDLINVLDKFSGVDAKKLSKVDINLIKRRICFIDKYFDENGKELCLL